MTFSTYFKTINKSGVFDTSQDDLVIAVYEKAGCIGVIQSNTAKQWLKRNRPGRPLGYFKNGIINNSGFIEYFNDNIADSWRILQKTFSMLENKGVVNCETDNCEEFIFSLLMQFYEILGLVWHEPPSKQMYKLFNSAIQECNIIDFLESDPTHRLQEDLSDDVDRFISIIKNDIINHYSKHSDDEMYSSISDFTEALFEYNEYLPYNMRPSVCMDGYYVPLHGEADMAWVVTFEKETLRHRQKIAEKYKHILGLGG